MNKQFVLIISFLFLVCGCATTKNYSPAAGLDKENLSSRTVPAKISKESGKTLERKGYAYIGSVQFEDTVKTCWGDDCKNFTCTANIPHKDTTKEVLERAASQGGDLVVLDKDSVLSRDITEKKGKCLGGHHTDYTEQECSGGYGNIARYCRNVTKRQFHCTNWLTVYGEICKFKSTGDIWRYDPELAKRLAVFIKEKEKKEKKEKEEKDKKEKEAGKIKAQIASLEKAYEENYPFQKDEFVDVKVDGQYGFKDKNGRIVIKPQFTDTMHGFSDGLAVVSVGLKNEKKWGIIDKAGKWIMHPSDKYKSIGKYSDGMVNIEVDNHCGYVNTKGQLVITPQFKRCWWFSEGLALVWVDKKYKYIDKTGKVALEPQVDMAYQFSDGLAAIEVDKKFGYIDKKGNVIIKPQFDNAERFVKGIAKARVDGEWKYIDKSGKYISEP